MSGLIVSPPDGGNQLPAYRQISDPLAWCQEIGKALHPTFGLNSPHHGTIMALTCLTENISVSKYHQRYHSDGTMRATAIQAEFQARGGRIEWLNLGDDGKEAKAKFSHPTHQAVPVEVKYTIEDARRQVGVKKFDADGSNWKTNPGAMLRAALIRKAVKIIDPGIVAGYDDFSDIEEQNAQQQQQATQAAARKAGLDAMAKEPAKAPIIDAEVVEKSPPPVSKPADPPPFIPEPETDKPCTNEQLEELVALATKLPSEADPQRKMNIQEIADAVRTGCNVSEPDQATMKQIDEIIARIRVQLSNL